MVLGKSRLGVEVVTSSWLQASALVNKQRFPLRRSSRHNLLYTTTRTVISADPHCCARTSHFTLRFFLFLTQTARLNTVARYDDPAITSRIMLRVIPLDRRSDIGTVPTPISKSTHHIGRSNLRSIALPASHFVGT